jgi:hypothetical protein
MELRNFDKVENFPEGDLVAPTSVAEAGGEFSPDPRVEKFSHPQMCGVISAL